MSPFKEAYMQPEPAFLYVDGGDESKSAETLLRNHGIPIHVVEGCLDAGWNYPLLQFHPWEFEGLTKIRRFLALSGI